MPGGSGPKGLVPPALVPIAFSLLRFSLCKCLLSLQAPLVGQHLGPGQRVDPATPALPDPA